MYAMTKADANLLSMQDIGDWDKIVKLALFGAMFLRATSFNQDLSNWDVEYFD